MCNRINRIGDMQFTLANVPRMFPPQSLLNPYNLRVSIQEIVTLKSHLGDKDVMAALSKLSVKIR